MWRKHACKRLQLKVLGYSLNKDMVRNRKKKNLKQSEINQNRGYKQQLRTASFKTDTSSVTYSTKCYKKSHLFKY